MGSRFLNNELVFKNMVRCNDKYRPPQLIAHKKKEQMATMVAEVFAERYGFIDAYEVNKIVKMKLEYDYLCGLWMEGLLWRKEAVVTAIDPEIITDKNLAKIVSTADTVLKKAMSLLRDIGENRTGGYMTIIREDMWPLAFRIFWGEIPLEKAPKYAELSLEKVCRLMDYPHHFASFQSRCPDALIALLNGGYEKWGEWGGAIRAIGYLLSFSGLPELWDEAVMFVTAINAGILDRVATLRRISRKRNPYLRPLLAAVSF